MVSAVLTLPHPARSRSEPGAQVASTWIGVVCTRDSARGSAGAWFVHRESSPASRRAFVKHYVRLTALAVVLLGTVVPAWAGSIFLTGHDPDFHAAVGFFNPLGAQHINQVAIGFVTDPLINPFSVPGSKFLFVESSISPPGGHVVGKTGIVASGFTEGTHFDHADASTLGAALDELGTTYDALWIASSTQFDEFEVDNTLTAFGASLGLTLSDINGNFSHTIFTGIGPLDVVDFNAAGDILSAAGRPTTIPPVPEPTTAATLGAALVATVLVRRKRR